MDFEIETVGCGQIRPKSINPTEIHKSDRNPTNEPTILVELKTQWICY